MSSCRVTGLGVFCVPPIGVKPVQEPPRKAQTCTLQQRLHICACVGHIIILFGGKRLLHLPVLASQLGTALGVWSPKCS